MRDPFALGLVRSVAHPEGNITGPTNAFFSIGGVFILVALVWLVERSFPQANGITLTKSCRCNNFPLVVSEFQIASRRSGSSTHSDETVNKKSALMI